MVWKDLLSDSGGVTPVMGEILMVGITVVLATSVGAFVFGMGTPEMAPMSVLEVSDSSADLVNDGTDNVLLSMQHKGGDTLEGSELKLMVKNSTISETLSWSDTDSRWSGGGLETNVFNNGAVSIGDVITISENGTNVVDTAGDYSVQMVHVPSNAMLVDSKLILE